MTDSNVQAKISKYIRLRDYKKAADDEFKASMQRVNDAMKILETELLTDLVASGGDSIACKGVGTVYKRVEMTCTVEDRDAYMAFLERTEEWEALDVKANKTFVKEWIAKGNDIPPGLKISNFTTVGVRK